MKTALGKTQSVRIFGDDYNTPDGTCVRDYIHVSDLARAHLLAIESDFCGAMNLGTSAGFSVRQIIDAAREITGQPIPAQVVARRPGDPDFLVSDPTKAFRELGWKAQITQPAEIIRSAWEWHRANPKGYQN